MTTLVQKSEGFWRPMRLVWSEHPSCRGVSQSQCPSADKLKDFNPKAEAATLNVTRPTRPRTSSRLVTTGPFLWPETPLRSHRKHKVAS